MSFTHLQYAPYVIFCDSNDELRMSCCYAYLNVNGATNFTLRMFYFTDINTLRDHLDSLHHSTSPGCSIRLLEIFSYT